MCLHVKILGLRESGTGIVRKRSFYFDSIVLLIFESIDPSSLNT